jgi:predicted HTH domain antitoxin
MGKVKQLLSKRRKVSADMQISFSLPDNQFITESPEEVTQKIRMYAALGLYQAGELSIGAASELAGVDRYTFLDFCKQEGVTLQTQTPEELEADLKKFATGN